MILLVTFLIVMTKCLAKGNLLEEKFALAHSSNKATIHHGREGTVAGVWGSWLSWIYGKEAECNQEMGLSHRL